MKREDLRRIIAEELAKLREAMPLPLEDEDEDDRFTADQREQDHRLENPGLYAGDEEGAEEMASRSSLGRAKELMRAVEVGAAAVRAGEDSDLLTDDALQAAKAAMLEDPDATGDDVENAIYAALYYDYFPEMLRETEEEEEEDVEPLPKYSPEVRKRFQRQQSQVRDLARHKRARGLKSKAGV